MRKEKEGITITLKQNSTGGKKSSVHPHGVPVDSCQTHTCQKRGWRTGFENHGSTGFGSNQKSAAVDFRVFILPLLCSPSAYIQKEIRKKCILHLARADFICTKPKCSDPCLCPKFWLKSLCINPSVPSVPLECYQQPHRCQGIQKGPFSLWSPHFFECKMSWRLPNYLISHVIHWCCLKVP